jgi:hypothetical protein
MRRITFGAALRLYIPPSVARQLQYAAHHSVAAAPIGKDDVLRCTAVLQYLTLSTQIHRTCSRPGKPR